MKTFRVISDKGIEALKQEEAPDPSPGRGEVVVRVRANSLNYRDTIVLQGGYPRNDNIPTVPLSDMAGEITAIGEGVTKWKVGDRVMANFMRDFVAGGHTEQALRTSLGGGVDGTLAEFVCLPAHSLVAIPEHLDFNEASTLPCAAVTAWNGLQAGGLKAGDTVLLLGTGGVSIFGLQFAKAAGARAIITSSSDEKLSIAKKLGADATINYKTHPEWHEQVAEITDGRGADIVLEVGGLGTLQRSLRSTRVGGTISLIGLLDMPEHNPNVLPLLMNAAKMQGIYVGSVADFESMNRAIAANSLRPVIDRTFPFDKAREAYEYFMAQKHVGKVVITQE